MKNVFIFSNSYLTNTVMYNIEYILNIKIQKIILLQENHLNKGDFDYVNGIKVEVYKNLHVCLELADIVLILYDKWMPNKTVNFIKNYSSDYQVICLDISGFLSEFSTNFDYIKNICNQYVDIPIILCASIGMATQQYCVEILVNNILSKNNVKFKHFFTRETTSFLQDLYRHNLLNEKLYKNSNCIKDQQTTDYDVIVVSVNLGSDVFNINERINILKSINADYLILSINANLNEAALIERLICSYSLIIDAIIMSHYFCIYDIPDFSFVHLDMLKFNGDVNVFDIESSCVEDDLTFDLLKKLSLPQGIKKIQ